MPAARFADSLKITTGALDAQVSHAAAGLRDRGFAQALFAREPAAWSSDAAVQGTIGNRLGWLTSPASMASEVERLTTFADSVIRDGFTDVVLLGMGGSSLAPEVLRAVIGVQAGRPRFTMLDSVNPDHLQTIATDPHHTLYILASKSGSTIEPNVLAAYFRQRLLDAGVSRWATHFVAITDPDTALDTRASTEGFRDVFRNPADIGGRYSAMSFFGLVPAALMGCDVSRLVADARAMLAAGAATDEGDPALALGVLAGAAALAGRDKLTLVVPPALEPFGLWIEQLVAESTGKAGMGIVPITGEPLGDAGEYGDDRVIVRVRLAGDHAGEPARDELVGALAARGTPVAEIVMQAPEAIGAEFVRWELATATAAAVMGINPFDEPNVQQAKDATRVLLDAFKREGRLPAGEPDADVDDASMTLSEAARRGGGARRADALLRLLGPGDYLSVLAYLPESPALTGVIASFRAEVRRRTGCATMFGYGPRYLHSTGQLHKGGPNTGVFLVLTAPGADMAIPGEPFTFGILELAQALGDMTSLDRANRRALHVHLPRPDAQRVERACEWLLRGLSEES
jgi:transaldolase / glucose-6-phosphate isomerase